MNKRHTEHDDTHQAPMYHIAKNCGRINVFILIPANMNIAFVRGRAGNFSGVANTGIRVSRLKKYSAIYVSAGKE